MRPRFLGWVSALLLIHGAAIADFRQQAHAAEPSIASAGAALEALARLREGNRRFIEGEPAHPQQGLERRRELVAGQKPSAIVLSCSDSRVPPELVFDQGLGEIFTVRVAGNVLGSATVASIEYAVEQLGVRLIVVMGHESCSAIQLALTTERGQSAGSPDLDALVAALQPSLELSEDSMPSATPWGGDKTLRKPVMQNVDAVASRLVSRSRIIRRHVEAGELRVVRAIYGMTSGKVDFWGLP